MKLSLSIDRKNTLKQSRSVTVFPQDSLARWHDPDGLRTPEFHRSPCCSHTEIPGQPYQIPSIDDVTLINSDIVFYLTAVPLTGIKKA